ncbi:MAG: MFS transporter [Clostridia bacterium]|nr:MFS transporter [Clostridia bacterium]
MQKLWTKNFTIITLGTVISMLGNAVSGFAIGLMVYDFTESTLKYALFMVCYSLPRVLMPLLAGPYIDRFSRRKLIYSLDFFSSGMYVVIALVLAAGWFNYYAFLLVSLLVGAIDSVYAVSYESLYPMLIPKGCFSKAYSISSLIYPLASTIMVPVAGICYNTIGLIPLFAFNAVSFAVAAIFETQIKVDEAHVKSRQSERFNAKRFVSDLKEGANYLRAEKGLLCICLYFFATMLFTSAETTLALPFFRSSDPDTFRSLIPGLLDIPLFSSAEGRGVAIYTFVMSMATVGRLIGGTLHYSVKLPAKRKYAIALFVYCATCVISGVYLFTSVEIMCVLMLMSGILGVNSYNIRISSTQNYVPDEKRGRYNGITSMIMTSGSLIGQLLFGTLGEAFDTRLLISCAMAVNLLCIVIMVFGRNEVKAIYNNDV